MSVAESPQAALPETKRRSWQFRWSLRVLIAGITAFCLLLGLLSYWRQEGLAHEDVAKELRKLAAEHPRGYAFIHWTYSDWVAENAATLKPKSDLDFQQVPAWLEQFGLGPVVQRIDMILLNGDVCTEETMPAAVEQIVRIRRLEELTIDKEEPITVAQLGQILDEVEIERLAVAPIDLGQGRLPCLNHPGLKYLHLRETDFSNPAIDDLPISLEHFFAGGTRIDDEGLPKFRRLTNLKYLNLRNTRASEPAIQRLREQMPRCEIHWHPLTHF